MVQFSCEKQAKKRAKADALVLFCFKNKKGAQVSSDLIFLKEHIHGALEDLKGKVGETALVYGKKLPENRIILVGIGDKKECSAETLRRAMGAVGKLCVKKNLATLNVWMPQLSLDGEEAVKAIADGLLLVNYRFDHLRSHTARKKEEVLVSKVRLYGASKKEEAEAKRCAFIAQGVYLTRDLANGNADDVTPQYLCKVAKDLAKKSRSLKATIFDKKRIEKEKMGLILAVNRGSAIDPALIILEYKGNPRSKDHTVIVGKGITYDTGGLNLKPTGYMETMKSDMSGGATCLGLVKAALESSLKANFTIVIPTTENGVDAKSYKPGDVYKSYAGKTVEILNTDAEGRLVLADALAYSAKKLKPTRIIDLATLTGAVEVALGTEASGIMSNNDDLADAMFAAGEATGEKVWRLPLYPEYTERLKSDVADLKNICLKRAAGASVAAAFLQEFVDGIPWIHFDIAGTAFVDAETAYLPKYSTGTSIRLLMEYFRRKK